MKSSVVRVGAVLAMVTASVFAMQGVSAAATSAPSAAPPATPPSVTHDQAFLVAASHDFLGRAATGAQLDSVFSAPLATMTARASVVGRMGASPEYVQVTVGALYTTALGRPGDADGVAYWSHLIESHKVSVAGVASMLYSSNEYSDEFGLTNNGDWVLRLYQKLLDRDGNLDPSGVNYWTGQAQRVGRYRVAFALYQSSESRHDRVAVLYQDLLGRVPDGAGWDYWSDVVLHHGDLKVAAVLAASDEYYQRAFDRYHGQTISSAPIGVVADAGSAKARVSWNAPGWLGGSPIAHYTVTASHGGQTCTAIGASTCTVTGLTNGSDYTFTVTATNDIGPSSPSDPSMAVTPTLLGWSPPMGAVPASGTVLYLQSDAGDFIGNSRTYLFTLANSVMQVTAVDAQLHLSIRADDSWWLGGSGPTGGDLLTPGYWQGLNRSQFDFSGAGRGCNTDSTDLQVDDVEYDTSGVLQRYTMRFLQHCEGGTPALRGFFRYDASDQTTPPPPGNPADFSWHPPAGVVPATGNFLYLQGSPGDFISGGNTWLIVPPDQLALSDVYDNANDVSITAATSEGWTVWLFGQSSQTRLTTGLYTNVKRAPFNNPVAGGFSVWGDGRGCNESVSTMAIDQISYDTAGNVASISARFVQHCETSTAPPLYGALRFG